MAEAAAGSTVVVEAEPMAEAATGKTVFSI
jgi:hypothetical protein